MASTSSTTLDRPAPRTRISRRAVWLLLALLLVAFIGWGYVLMRLTSASKEGVDNFENRVRHALVHRGYLPRSYRHWYPDHQDLIKHFVFYAPFGLMAGLAASIVRLSPPGTFPPAVTSRRIALGLMVLGVSLSTADEIRQIWNPTRSAEVLDLLAGWGGIFTAFFLWHLAERGILLTAPHRLLQRIWPWQDHRP